MAMTFDEYKNYLATARDVSDQDKYDALFRRAGSIKAVNKELSAFDKASDYLDKNIFKALAACFSPSVPFGETDLAELINVTTEGKNKINAKLLKLRSHGKNSTIMEADLRRFQQAEVILQRLRQKHTDIINLLRDIESLSETVDKIYSIKNEITTLQKQITEKQTILSTGLAGPSLANELSQLSLQLNAKSQEYWALTQTRYEMNDKISKCLIGNISTFLNSYNAELNGLKRVFSSSATNKTKITKSLIRQIDKLTTKMGAKANKQLTKLSEKQIEVNNMSKRLGIVPINIDPKSLELSPDIDPASIGPEAASSQPNYERPLTRINHIFSYMVNKNGKVAIFDDEGLLYKVTDIVGLNEFMENIPTKSYAPPVEETETVAEETPDAPVEDIPAETVTEETDSRGSVYDAADIALKLGISEDIAAHLISIPTIDPIFYSEIALFIKNNDLGDHEKDFINIFNLHQTGGITDDFYNRIVNSMIVSKAATKATAKTRTKKAPTKKDSKPKAKTSNKPDTQSKVDSQNIVDSQNKTDSQSNIDSQTKVDTQTKQQNPIDKKVITINGIEYDEQTIINYIAQCINFYNKHKYLTDSIVEHICINSDVAKYVSNELVSIYGYQYYFDTKTGEKMYGSLNQVTQIKNQHLQAIAADEEQKVKQQQNQDDYSQSNAASNASDSSSSTTDDEVKSSYNTIGKNFNIKQEIIDQAIQAAREDDFVSEIDFGRSLGLNKEESKMLFEYLVAQNIINGDGTVVNPKQESNENNVEQPSQIEPQEGTIPDDEIDLSQTSEKVDETIETPVEESTNTSKETPSEPEEVVVETADIPVEQEVRDEEIVTEDVPVVQNDSEVNIPPIYEEYEDPYKQPEQPIESEISEVAETTEIPVEEAINTSIEKTSEPEEVVETPIVQDISTPDIIENLSQSEENKDEIIEESKAEEQEINETIIPPVFEDSSEQKVETEQNNIIEETVQDVPQDPIISSFIQDENKPNEEVIEEPVQTEVQSEPQIVNYDDAVNQGDVQESNDERPTLDPRDFAPQSQTEGFDPVKAVDDMIPKTEITIPSQEKGPSTEHENVHKVESATPTTQTVYGQGLSKTQRIIQNTKDQILGSDMNSSSLDGEGRNK